ncbi:MAG: hypothetical protein Q9213_001253 [Squamulea squamosa]
MGHRRNAIKPDDVEQLLINRPGIFFKAKHQKAPRLSRETCAWSLKSRPCSNHVYPITMDMERRPVFGLDPHDDSTPLALPRPSTQQTMAFNGKDSSFQDLQTKPSTRTGAARKRKHAAMCEDFDSCNIQPAPFDVVHPSEIDPNDEDVDADDEETVHDSFPTQIQHFLEHLGMIFDATFSEGRPITNLVNAIFPPD